MRIGHGYDVHKLTEGRKLILGGVEVPHPTGLLGHSDADVLVHAVMDALLGAAALGDIGRRFPDTDPAFLGADSMQLLDRVLELLRERGYRVGNLDATVVAQRPKLQEFLPQMRKNLAAACGVPLGDVNLKATTEEHLGFTGREEGVAAHAVCLLERQEVRRLRSAPERAAAADLAWEVFLEFEAPEYSQEGVENFRMFLEHDLNSLCRDGRCRIWGAFRDGRLQGMAAVRDGGHICLLFVRRESQRRGLAGELMAHAERFAREEGETRLTVNASPCAVEIYRRWGFAAQSEEQCVDGIRFTPMLRALEPGSSGIEREKP